MVRCLGLLALASLAVCGRPEAAGATVRLLGAAPPSETVSLVLPLKVDAAGMQQFALAVSTRGSPQFGQFQTVGALAQRFGASQAERNRVLNYFHRLRVRAVAIDSTGSMASVTMRLALAERVFGTAARAFRSSDGRRFLAPAMVPTIPAALRGALTGVVGLDTRPVFTGNAVLRSGSTSAQSSQRFNTGTSNGSYCAGGRSAGEVAGDPTTRAYTPDEYLGAYDFTPVQNGGVTGIGQRVALIEVDSVKTSDLATFASCFHLRLPPVQQFKVGISKLPRPGLEPTLDAEIVDAAAPGLRSIDMYETRDDAASVLNAIDAPFQKPHVPPAAISISGGACDPAVQQELGVAGLEESQYLFEGATSTGTSVIASSGDSGSAGCQQPSGYPLHGLAVQYPASSWWVTAVGGTNFQLTKQNQIVPGSEVVWNDQTQPPAAGGGGLSAIWVEPKWQKLFISPSRAHNARVVPDIALLADPVPGYAVYCTAPGCGSGGWQPVGGTSAGAPLFAGGVAMIDQVAKAQNKEPMGGSNGEVYSIAYVTQWRAASFHDVTRGSNDVYGLGCCTATRGFDPASGFGSINMDAFGYYSLAIAGPYLGEVRAIVPAHQHPLKVKRLVVKVTCSRACHQTAEAVITIGNSQPIQLFDGIPPRIVHLSRAGSSKFELSLNGYVSRMRSALKHHQKVLAVIYGELTDSAGNFEKNSPPVPFYITS